MNCLNASLESRLKSCLQTILDLEETLSESDLGVLLQKEFSLLKEVAKNLQSTPLEEAEVQKIEETTAHFLEELQESFNLANLAYPATKHPVH